MFMTRYFFHCQDGLEIDDSDGQDLPSVEAAFEHAKNVANAYRHLMSDGMQNVTVVITDEDGAFVALVPCGID